MGRRSPPALASPLARRRQSELAVAAIAVAVVLLLGVFVVWPLVRLLVTSLREPGGVTLANYAAFVSSWRLFGILLNSLLGSAISTVITVAIALVLAYAMTCAGIPGKRLISLLVVLPLLSPPFLAALAFILLFGHQGGLTHALRPGWSIYGLLGIVVSQVFTFLPHAYVLLENVLENIDSALEEAAVNLGAGPVTTLRRVTLSLARPGLASAALIVFILCMTDFGNPILIGRGYPVLTTEIYTRVIGMNDLAAGATMSVVLLLPCLVAYRLNTSGPGSASYVRFAATARAAQRPTPRLLRRALFGASAGVALCVGIIYALILLGSLVRQWGSDWSLSLQHYGFKSTAEGAAPIWNSVKLALLSGVLGTVLALVTASVIERQRSPGTRTVELLSMLPAALPGPLVGVAYLVAFNRPPVLLTGTVWVLVASVVFWGLPVAVRAGIDAFKRIDPAIEEAAVSLGVGSVRAFARIIMPLLTSTAFSIFVYFFINGMVTLSAVIFLIFPGFNLGAPAILAHMDNGDPGGACALGTIILAIVIAAMLVLRALPGGDRAAILKA